MTQRQRDYLLGIDISVACGAEDRAVTPSGGSVLAKPAWQGGIDSVWQIVFDIVVAVVSGCILLKIAKEQRRSP